MFVQSYTELEVWKVSRELCNASYLLTKKFPKDELFGLTNQIRRSATSIPSNIAESYGRNGKNDKLQFLFIARGSLYELETQFLISSDQGYVTNTNLEKVINQISQCKKLLNGFISYHKK